MEFWRALLENPSEEKSMNDFAIAIDEIPKIVFSHTLKKLEWNSAKLSNQPGKQEIVITREFDLPVELLFKAHTEPEIVWALRVYL